MFIREIKLGKTIIPKFLVISLLKKKKKKKSLLSSSSSSLVHHPYSQLSLSQNAFQPKALTNSFKWPLVLLSLCLSLSLYNTIFHNLTHIIISFSDLCLFWAFSFFFQTNPFISNLNLTNFIKLRKIMILDFLSWSWYCWLKKPTHII